MVVEENIEYIEILERYLNNFINEEIKVIYESILSQVIDYINKSN